MTEDYEKSLGLNLIMIEKNKNDVEKYLNLSREELNKSSGEMCGEAAILLSQYAFFIQKAINKEISIVNWTSSLIDRIIAPVMNNYNGASALERKMAAIKDNEFALACEKLKTSAQIRVDQISYLSAKVDSISHRFSELQQTKRVKNG